ncbi:unnamed protein product [Symbiodinium pilosum]|uniref:Uncharacterized protein n=1 Tax=Symbiodinium pilosum TaxID=2952 RepID=A0A812PM32_SYMPI|nr:unnamed protein product [Symbiodinium pilosum]
MARTIAQSEVLSQDKHIAVAVKEKERLESQIPFVEEKDSRQKWLEFHNLQYKVDESEKNIEDLRNERNSFQDCLQAAELQSSELQALRDRTLPGHIFFLDGQLKAEVEIVTAAPPSWKRSSTMIRRRRTACRLSSVAPRTRRLAATPLSPSSHTLPRCCRRSSSDS